MTFFVSCQEEEAAVDSQPPTVVISSPQEGASLSTSDEVALKVLVSDDVALSAVTVEVALPSGGSLILLEQSQEDFTNDNRESAVDQIIPLEGNNFAPGEYIFTVEALDAAGNTTLETVSIELIEEVEPTTPEISITSPAEGAAFLPSEEITFEASVQDEVPLEELGIWVTPPGGEAQLVHSVEQSSFTNEGKEAAISETISFPAGSAPGNYILSLKASNVTGGEAEGSITIMLSEADEEAPAIAISQPEEGAEFYAGGVIPLNVLVEDNVHLASVSVSALFPDGHSQLLHEEPQEEFYNDSKAANIDVSLFLGQEPAAGDYILLVKAVDAQGNVAEQEILIKIKEADASAPTVNISSPEEGTVFEPTELINLQATAQDDEGLEEVSVWLAPPGEQAQLVHTESPENFSADGKQADIQEEISLGSENPAPGTYRIIVKAVDPFGNTTEKSISFTISGADVQAPVITLNSPEEGASYAVGSEVELDLVVEDDQELAEITLVVSYEQQVEVYEKTINEFDEPNRHQEQDSMAITSEAQPGTYYVSITATDAAGNAAEETYTFEVTK